MSDPRSLLERESQRFTQTEGAFERLARRRDRRHRNRRIEAGVLGLVIAIAVGWLGANAIRSAPPVPADPPEELGIFAPISGWIVYGDARGIWGVDPDAPPDPEEKIYVTTEAGTPLGWSRDGTRLLIMQQIRDGRVVAEGGGWDSLRLVVLDADGSQTPVAERDAWITGATISPDGSRVVFGTYRGLYRVDVDGGRPVVLLDGGDDELETPTFSPDGAQIAYIAGSGDHSFRVWVMNADGSDTHEILANETTMAAGHVDGLAWSPAGDRIALGMNGTYTFAPDGSGFSEAPAGTRAFWSPDGSQLATRGEAWHPGSEGSDPSTPNEETQSEATPPPTPTEPMSDEPPVLHLQSWSQDFVELAVYADGRVIWVPEGGDDHYLQMRLTPEGVERLTARAVSTGLFERDLALGLDLRFGHVELRRENRSVIVGWGETPTGVSGLGMEDLFVDATPEQADELTELDAFLRDPVAWSLPPDMYVEPEASTFVPTHLWVSWDRNTPDPSKLPSPAREVLTRNLEASLDGRCETISIAQAQEIVLAMEQAGLIEPDDVLDGIAFTMPGVDGGGSSFLHAHPSLPHESSCD